MTERSDDERLTRRRFLRVGVGSTLLLGLGGALAWNATGYEARLDVRRRLRLFSVKEHAVLAAIAARILRSDDRAFPAPDTAEVALFVDGFVAELHPDDARDVQRLLHLIEHLLPPSAGHLSRFTRLDAAARDAVLADMQRGTPLMRAGLDALRSLVAMGYFRDPRTWPALGYDGPLVGRPAGGWA